MRTWFQLAPIATVTLLLAAMSAAVLAPTDCSCGAAVPHPHVLYELPGHHHDHQHGALPTDESDTSASPRLTLPVSTSSPENGLPIALLAVSIAFLLQQNQRRLRPAAIEDPSGLSLEPPDPPPRGERARRVARSAPVFGPVGHLEVGAP